jgi:hypothetical protein
MAVLLSCATVLRHTLSSSLFRLPRVYKTAAQQASVYQGQKFYTLATNYG